MSVLDELVAREPLFHREELGTTRARFEAMMVDDYWEVAGSGAIYDRTFVLDILDKRHSGPHEDPWAVSEFDLRQLSDDTYLLTYLLDQAGRISRRMTIWRRDPNDWVAVYHQGTLVAS